MQVGEGLTHAIGRTGSVSEAGGQGTRQHRLLRQAQHGFDHVVERLGVAEQVVGVPGTDDLAPPCLDGRPPGGGRREERRPFPELGSNPGQHLPHAAGATPHTRPAPHGQHGGGRPQRREVGGDVPLAAGPGGAGLQQPARDGRAASVPRVIRVGGSGSSPSRRPPQGQWSRSRRVDRFGRSRHRSGRYAWRCSRSLSAGQSATFSVAIPRRRPGRSRPGPAQVVDPAALAGSPRPARPRLLAKGPTGRPSRPPQARRSRQCPRTSRTMQQRLCVTERMRVRFPRNCPHLPDGRPPDRRNRLTMTTPPSRRRKPVARDTPDRESTCRPAAHGVTETGKGNWPPSDGKVKRRTRNTRRHATDLHISRYSGRRWVTLASSKR